MTESRILEMLLAVGGEMYGLEMVDSGEGKLKRGTIYVTLQRLQQKGLVDSRLEPRTPPETGIPRRLYSITGFGQRVLEAYEAAHSTLASALAGGE